MTYKRILGAVAMLIIGEAVYFGTDIWKYWLEVNSGQPIKAGIREAAVEKTAQEFSDRIIHLSRPLIVKTPVRCYPADAERVYVSSWDGNGSTTKDWIEMLERFDHKLFTPQSIKILEPPTEIVPFVHWARREERRGFADPNAKRDSSGVATMKLDDLGGVECVVAAIGDQIVFIPLGDYKAAGLPMS
jgi:hypothetical protein